MQRRIAGITLVESLNQRFLDVSGRPNLIPGIVDNLLFESSDVFRRQTSAYDSEELHILCCYCEVITGADKVENTIDKLCSVSCLLSNGGDLASTQLINCSFVHSTDFRMI
ncbi:hypothetical protein PlfCFBP13513_04180 [Plantibacter flavus]|nr:hypothetical protein PlfCFBP13513_04180 [Plantibacter flavus]